MGPRPRRLPAPGRVDGTVGTSTHVPSTGVPPVGTHRRNTLSVSCPTSRNPLLVRNRLRRTDRPHLLPANGSKEPSPVTSGSPSPRPLPLWFQRPLSNRSLRSGTPQRHNPRGVLVSLLLTGPPPPSVRRPRPGSGPHWSTGPKVPKRTLIVTLGLTVLWNWCSPVSQ